MDLHSDPLFWPRYKPDPTFFEPLNADAACDVAVIGAGVTGALAAYHLARESISVDVLDPEVRDRQIEAKAQALVEKFHTLMPRLPLQPAFKWAGTFAQTKDGLPYIGCTPQFPHGYFALSYGGNGITFSLIAAKIMTDLFLGRPNEDAELFRFDR